MPFSVRVSSSRRPRLERPRDANRKAGRRPGGVRITKEISVTWAWSRSGAGALACVLCSGDCDPCIRPMAIQLAYGMRTLHLPAYAVHESLFLLPH